MTSLDEILILRTDLEQLERAIEGARNFHEADDLSKAYKNFGGINRPSNLTRALNNALQKATYYLAEEEPESDE